MHPAAEGQFEPHPGSYLDSASYGLPPRTTVAALRQALDAWSVGAAQWIVDWDEPAERCRGLAGSLLGARPSEVAFLPAVSVGSAVVFSQLAEGDEVLVPADEFASVLLPALASAASRGVSIRRAPFEGLADAVRASTTLVATSHVRSQDGRVQDLAAVSSAAKDAGSLVLVDATHSAGILPIDADADGLDFVLCAAYKHLLCPRGVAFMTVAESQWSRFLPVAASWRSAAQRYDHYYGPELSVLAPSAARYDVSLAWHAWFGAVPALEFLCSVPASERMTWPTDLATDLAHRLGLKATGSSVIAVGVDDGDRARRALQDARVRTSGRGSAVRVSFHLYNDEHDVAAASRCLLPFVAR